MQPPSSHTPFPPGSLPLLSPSLCAGYIDVEADEIAPGYAVLLMYMMLVRLRAGRQHKALLFGGVAGQHDSSSSSTWPRHRQEGSV